MVCIIYLLNDVRLSLRSTPDHIIPVLSVLHQFIIHSHHPPRTPKNNNIIVMRFVHDRFIFTAFIILGCN